MIDDRHDALVWNGCGTWNSAIGGSFTSCAQVARGCTMPTSNSIRLQWRRGSQACRAPSWRLLGQRPDQSARRHHPRETAAPRCVPRAEWVADARFLRYRRIAQAPYFSCMIDYRCTVHSPRSSQQAFGGLVSASNFSTYCPVMKRRFEGVDGRSRAAALSDRQGLAGDGQRADALTAVRVGGGTAVTVELPVPLVALVMVSRRGVAAGCPAAVGSPGHDHQRVEVASGPAIDRVVGEMPKVQVNRLRDCDGLAGDRRRARPSATSRRRGGIEVTVPLPDPGLPPLMVSHPALLVAVQVHPVADVTAVVDVPPAAVSVRAVGETPNVQDTPF